MQLLQRFVKGKLVGKAESPTVILTRGGGTFEYKSVMLADKSQRSPPLHYVKVPRGLLLCIAIVDLLRVKDLIFVEHTVFRCKIILGFKN